MPPSAHWRGAIDVVVGERGRVRDAGATATPPQRCSTRAILAGVDDPPKKDETRIDRWLCAVRLVKTRPTATQLCDAGHVLVNGTTAKPSTKVRAGDRVDALIAGRERIVEVVRPIESRVGAPVAGTCYVDHSPPPVVTEVRPGIMAVRGEGRPSKRLRRELERLRRAAEA
jgi:ribosome-associated heat shock protein Hsp15